MAVAVPGTFNLAPYRDIRVGEPINGTAGEGRDLVDNATWLYAICNRANLFERSEKDAISTTVAAAAAYVDRYELLVQLSPDTVAILLSMRGANVRVEIEVFDDVSRTALLDNITVAIVGASATASGTAWKN